VRSKGVDGFTPLGPRLLDARAVDLGALRLRTWVNGELAQDASPARDMLFGFGDIVADLSRLVTLEPGDVILTGTPAGSTVVQPGDVVEVEVSAGENRSSGRLRSPIVAADYSLAPPGAMPRADDAARAAAYGAARGPGQRPEELLAGLREVSTATLASLLRKRGLNGLTLDGLRSTRPGARLAGYARTVRYLPLREDLFATHGGGMNAQRRAIEEIRPGEVLVIEARGDQTAGTIGDILALRAQVRGAAGVVTDGAIRDSAALAALEIPVYHAAVHPAVLGRRHVPWEADVTVACAGVTIQPGDIVVGDADGVVVLPPAIAAGLLADAREQETEEEFIAERIAAGEHLDGLHPLGDRWHPAYEAWRKQRDHPAQPGVLHWTA
jgi:regulator of RNase E activity RraA